ncbi:Golgi resident protein GCP60 [Lycorma delicatula]|uniref:Golgi resident protein GCP60 n=1 Tax=Lycorma delicatula TaxID=130591 RepID=UPI003F511D48
MASERDVDPYKLESNFSHLSINDVCKVNKSLENGISNDEDESALKWGFPLKELYRLALRFYKEKEGKAFNFSYQDKLKSVALTQQVSHGKYNADILPPLGVLDVIGRDRRLAWQALGDATKVQAMEQFINLLDQQCPLFKPTIDAHKADTEERERLRKEEDLRKKKEEERQRLEEEVRIKEEQEMLKQEAQRRQIQEALNQQTYTQFKAYAEQQYPGNPEQQAVLVRQLQDQHYHQYMQQLMQQQLSGNNKSDSVDSSEETSSPLLIANGDVPHDEPESEEEGGGSQTISLASMWTRKDVKQFKDSIRKEGGDAIIKVGHGETVTVRVPTHEDGTCLFWEFATDNYDIGFGVYFEWTKSPTNQVSVHVSESEDDDDDVDEDDDDDDDDEEFPDDVERANSSVSKRLEAAANRPPLSIIVPVYRRDCQDEVYAGSHTYPGQGVYLLKFDNSYSLWRSKTLYYRVYYTR